MARRIILLRHAEKPLGKSRRLQLSAAGKKRAQFLARTLLGCGATRSLLGKHGPDAFVAITPHTIETACPSAESWNMPVTVYGTVASGRAREDSLDLRTQEAACDVNRSKAKTIVMVWEHKRIADSTRDPETTLRRLLNLEKVAPPDWPDDDYDSIWIAEFHRSGKVKHFDIVRQHFRAAASRKAKRKKAPVLTGPAAAPISKLRKKRPGP